MHRHSMLPIVGSSVGQLSLFRPSFLTKTSLQMASSNTEEVKPKRGRPKDPPEDDEAEWRMILAAFQMYKAAYGDLKVPSRFVVPAMAPWPGEFLFLIVSLLLVCCCAFVLRLALRVRALFVLLKMM